MFYSLLFLKFFILIHFFPRVIRITQMSHSPPQVDWLIQFSVGCEWVYSLFGLSTWRTVFRLENSLFFPEKWSKLRITQKFIGLRIVTYQTYAREVGVRFVFLQVKSSIDFFILQICFVISGWSVTQGFDEKGYKNFISSYSFGAYLYGPFWAIRKFWHFGPRITVQDLYLSRPYTNQAVYESFLVSYRTIKIMVFLGWCCINTRIVHIICCSNDEYDSL